MNASGESLFERYKNDVRTRLSLRELVEECKPKGLRATGASSLICCSPLRPDRHPSFSVFESGGEYIAFDHATRESFDLYGFIEKKEGLSFAEAVKWAGDRAGLPWDVYRKERGGESPASPPPPGFTQEEWDRAYEQVLALDERQIVANVQQAMVDLAHAMFLRSSLPTYVESRWGISLETQKRFLLGFVPHGFAELLEEFHEQGVFPYSRKQLVKTGWFAQRARFAGDPSPELRCIFDGRLLYPYLFRGKCRYACARIVHEDGIEPSYFEGREWDQGKFKKALVGGPSHPSVSPFVQNNILYNADNALRSRTGFKRIVIVEGPSDCMAMVEAGYDCVAPVTTSIRNEDTPMLLEAVKDYGEVILATDTDVTADGRRPGLEGALRMATELLHAGKRVRILVFPLAKGQSKMDPAAWSLEWKRAGKEGDPFAELMASAPGVASALVGFLPPDLTAAQLPEALTPIVKFARAAKAPRAETEEIARLVRARLRNNFTRNAILQAMGEVGERLDDEARAPVEQERTLQLEGSVVERGGHDEPGKTRCYEAHSKDGPRIISTFILQPERVIVSSTGDRLLEVSVHIESDTRLIEHWVVPRGAWVKRTEFLRSFPHERMQFTGDDNNLQAIYKLVSERAARMRVPVVRGEPVIGLHHTAGGLRLVLPGETWDASGKMADPDIVFSNEGSSPFASMIRVDGAQDPADVDDLCKTTLERIFTLNDPTVLTVLCAWIVGCYFLPEIRQMNGGKASILNVYGSPGSSKTTLMHRILNVTLLPFDSRFEPALPAETKFPIIRDLSWANILCAAFDEFRSGEANRDFLRILRTGFSGGIESRGRADLSVRSFPLVGGVQVSGEQRMDVDTAMGERLVMVGLSKTTIERLGRDVRDNLDALLNGEEKWRVATDILQWRMRVSRDQIRHWWEASRLIATDAVARLKLRLAPRTHDLCVETVFRRCVFEAWLGHRAERKIALPLASVDQMLLYVAATVSDRELDPSGSRVIPLSAKSLIVRALEEVTPYAHSGAFEESKGWRMAERKGRRMLVVYPALLVSTLAREARSRGLIDPTNGLAAVKRSAREEFDRDGETGWLVDPSFPFRMDSADDPSQESTTEIRARCWLIDVVKASEMVGLELDWPSSNVASWGRVKAAAGLPAWRKTTLGEIGE